MIIPFAPIPDKTNVRIPAREALQAVLVLLITRVDHRCMPETGETTTPRITPGTIAIKRPIIERIVGTDAGAETYRSMDQAHFSISRAILTRTRGSLRAVFRQQWGGVRMAT